MKYTDPYRDPHLVRNLLEVTNHLAAELAHPITIMEICGTHTQAIGRWGIRRLLPPSRPADSPVQVVPYVSPQLKILHGCLTSPRSPT